MRTQSKHCCSAWPWTMISFGFGPKSHFSKTWKTELPVLSGDGGINGSIVDGIGVWQGEIYILPPILLPSSLKLKIEVIPMFGIFFYWVNVSLVNCGFDIIYSGIS